MRVFLFFFPFSSGIDFSWNSYSFTLVFSTNYSEGYFYFSNSSAAYSQLSKAKSSSPEDMNLKYKKRI